MGFKEFILARDDLGVPFNISYKGSDTFPTSLGALCTMGIKALVLSQGAMLLISMVNMQDPLIRTY